MSNAAAPDEKKSLESVADVQALKDVANQSFTAGNNELALQQYTTALQALQKTPGGLETNAKLAAVIYSNRAAVRLKLKKFIAASSDAQESMDLDPDYWRGYWRRGIALTSMSPRIERFEQAKQAFERCATCSTLPEKEKKNVQLAIRKTEKAIQSIKDNTPMPEQCVLQ